MGRRWSDGPPLEIFDISQMESTVDTVDGNILKESPPQKTPSPSFIDSNSRNWLCKDGKNQQIGA